MYVKTISYRSAFFFVWKLLFEINSYKQQTIRSNEAICLMRRMFLYIFAS